MNTAKTYYGLIVIVVISFFSPTLFFDFLNWDDTYYVLQNPLIRSLNTKTLVEIFTPTTYVMGNYHPITILSYAIDYQIYGLSSRGFHATHILIHLLNSLLCFSLLSCFIKDKTINLALTFLFALHPIHNESVAWISDRKDLLATLFGLSYLLHFINGFQLPKTSILFWCINLIFFTLALLTKATMVVLVPLTLLYLLFFQIHYLKHHLVILFLGLLCCIAVWIGLIALKAQAWQMIDENTTRSCFERTLFSGYALEQYLLKFLYPFGLSAFYPYPKIHMLYLLPWITLILFVFYLIYKHHFTALFFVLSFVIAILPTLQLKPIGQAIIANRYLYFPSVFLLAGMGHVLQNNRIAIKLLWPVLILFLIISALHLQSWKNSISLWTNVLQQYPELGMAYLNRGDAYESKGDLKRAESDYKLAITFEQLPMAYIRKARLEENLEAIKTLQDCLEQHPTYEIAHNNIALLYKKQGEFKKALFHLNKAIEYAPKYADAYSNLGNVYVLKKDYLKALECYKKALELEPDNEIFRETLNTLTKQAIF